jgi:hypothetical protein
MPKKLHPIARVLEAGRTLPLDQLEAVIALLQAELRGKRPAPVAKAKKTRISSVPPVNEATRIGG